MDFLLAMRVFVRVVECGGLSAAGRSLGLGQPAVSERLRQLENHLGARLLDRNTRSVNVTDAGAVFYEQAKHAVTAADDAAACVASLNGQLRGTLRIAAPHSIGETILPPLLVELRQQHPELSIDLILNDLIVDPVMEGVDVSIRMGAVTDGGFIARRLGDVRRVLLASPAYLVRAGGPITLDNIGTHPFIHIDRLTRDNKLRLIGPDGSTVFVTIQSAWRCNHWHPLLSALIGGMGIGVNIPVGCAKALREGLLVPILTDYQVPSLPLHIIYPALRRPPIKTTAVVNWLQARIPPLLEQYA
jgi:DNA-binding transcriptional LysR family regulator